MRQACLQNQARIYHTHNPRLAEAIGSQRKESEAGQVNSLLEFPLSALVGLQTGGSVMGTTGISNGENMKLLGRERREGTRSFHSQEIS